MIILSELFWYRPLFMTELMIAEALFAFGLNRRSNFLWRLLASIIACYAFSFLFPILSYNAMYCSFMFCSMFAFTVLVMKFLFNESFVNIIYCAIAGYTTQHLAYQLNDCIVVLTGLNNGNPLNSYGSGVGSIPNGVGEADHLAMEFYWLKGFLRQFFTIFLYLSIFIIIYYLVFMVVASKIKNSEAIRLKNVSLVILVVMIVLIDIIFSSIVTYSNPSAESSVNLVLLYLYNILCCLLAFYIQFELPKRKKLEKELDTVNQLRHIEKENYLISKENIELINLKCHDLKHQIRKIGKQGSLGNDTIDEIEKVISIYDSIVKTGNSTLDIVLTEKSLACSRNNIKFSCIVDGQKLDFMSEEDIFSFFGNIIDNAIEAVGNLEDDKKIIGLSVKSKKGFLSILVTNYYNGEIKFEKGLPITTKKDKEYHGFGMKSVKQICDKYQGEMCINCENNIFNLSIVFSIN